jgi:peptidylprolyl isomerase
VVVGTGPTASATSTVGVEYVVLNYATGTVFDSSWTQEQSAPPQFNLAQAISGLGLGITGMKVGGRREIVIPPAFAFGSTGNEAIQPNETIVFVVDLKSVS